MQFSDILKVNFFSGITELDKVCGGGGCGGMSVDYCVLNVITF